MRCAPPSFSAALLARSVSAALDGASGLSIGTNHCGVQRKITLAFERQLVRITVLIIGGRREQRAGLAQVRADRPVGRVELGVDDRCPGRRATAQSSRYLPSASTTNIGSMPCALHSSKSSSPWSGAMWTRPVPLSVVTNSPGRNGRGSAKKPPRWCIGWRAMVPARSEPLTCRSAVACNRDRRRPASTAMRVKPVRVDRMLRSRSSATRQLPTVAHALNQRRTQPPAHRRTPG